MRAPLVEGGGGGGGGKFGKSIWRSSESSEALEKRVISERLPAAAERPRTNRLDCVTGRVASVIHSVLASAGSRAELNWPLGLRSNQGAHCLRTSSLVCSRAKAVRRVKSILMGQPGDCEQVGRVSWPPDWLLGAPGRAEGVGGNVTTLKVINFHFG